MRLWVWIKNKLGEVGPHSAGHAHHKSTYIPIAHSTRKARLSRYALHVKTAGRPTAPPSPVPAASRCRAKTSGTLSVIALLELRRARGRALRACSAATRARRMPMPISGRQTSSVRMYSASSREASRWSAGCSRAAPRGRGRWCRRRWRRGRAARPGSAMLLRAPRPWPRYPRSARRARGDLDGSQAGDVPERREDVREEREVFHALTSAVSGEREATRGAGLRAPRATRTCDAAWRERGSRQLRRGPRALDGGAEEARGTAGAGGPGASGTRGGTASRPCRGGRGSRRSRRAAVRRACRWR